MNTLLLAVLICQSADPAGLEREYRTAIRNLEPRGASPALSDTLNGLGTLYFDEGDFARAELLSRRSLDAELRLENPREIEVARRLNNVAAALSARGRYADAVDFARRAMEIYRRLGDSVDTAYAYNTLGVLELRTRRFTEAAQDFERAIALWHARPGDLAKGLGNLAFAYASMGRRELVPATSGARRRWQRRACRMIPGGTEHCCASWGRRFRGRGRGVRERR